MKTDKRQNSHFGKVQSAIAYISLKEVLWCLRQGALGRHQIGYFDIDQSLCECEARAAIDKGS